MRPTIPKSSTSVLQLTDLHLDKLDPDQIDRLLNHVAKIDCDCVCITGDVSIARHLREHLAALAAACAPRAVYMVCGNHDYYGSSVAAVDAVVKELCAETKNLHHLDGGQMIALNRHTCIIGHRGWADARAGLGSRSHLKSPDHRAIRDFHGLRHQQAMLRMNRMGKESAERIRRILPLALTRYRHVILLTHVPPYEEVARFNGRRCGNVHLPHFTNLSAGLAIRGIARAFPTRKITILSGHTHSHAVALVAPNLCVRVARPASTQSGSLKPLRFS